MDAMSVRRRDAGSRARYIAAAAAAVTAILYLLIGLGVLYVGKSTDTGSTDLFGFGAVMFVVFAAVTAALLVFPSKVVWAGVAVVQVVVLVGYFALANVRDPQFEPWGLLVKACQVVVLAAVAYLLLVDRRPRRSAVPVR